MQLELSERQQATVGVAVTILAAVVIVVVVAALFWLLGTFVSSFSNVFLPLAVAAVAALVFKPYFDLLRGRLRFPAPVALVAVFLSVLVPVGAFFWFFGSIVVEQVGDLVERIPALWETIADWVRERAPQVVAFAREHGLVERVGGAMEGGQDSLVEGIRSVGSRAWEAGWDVLRGVGALLAWAVFPVYFSFFLLSDPNRFQRIESLLPFLKSETRDDIAYLFREFVTILVAFFRGQLIIALLQGLLFALGFSLVGLRYGFVLGLMLGFLNIIPYLGSIVGLAIALPLAFFQSDGGLLLVVWVILVFTAVQMIEGYLLTPKIMGDRTGLHPVVIIIAVFFWGSALGGITGMILAIPLTAFLVVFWRLAREKYVTELV